MVDEGRNDREFQMLAAMAAMVEAQNISIKKMREDLTPRVELYNAVEELKNSRKRAIILIVIVFVLAVYSAIIVHDEHITRCYPPKNNTAEAICDITFPFHNHGDLQFHLPEEEEPPAEVRRPKAKGSPSPRGDGDGRPSTTVPPPQPAPQPQPQPPEPEPNPPRDRPKNDKDDNDPKPPKDDDPPPPTDEPDDPDSSICVLNQSLCLDPF